MQLDHFLTHLMALTAIFCAVAAEAAEVPFPSAVDSAQVVESRITDLKREALVLGNGELNALLWERDGNLCLRVTKNDIWDARIDTSRDPDLMTMNIRSRTWQGGAKRVPSWHGTPYPISVVTSFDRSTSFLPKRARNERGAFPI